MPSHAPAARPSQDPLARARMFVRRLQAPLRALPDFLIIGAQKSGTSSLHQYLAAQPQIRLGVRKEVHFFDGGLDPAIDAWALGEGWYRAHFPLRVEMAGCKTFEASPLYMFHPLAAERIARVLPRARLIAVLRNPTDRAISHYFHSHRDGREPLSLEAALAAEDARLAPILARGDYKQEAFRAISYRSRGLYAEQLARFRARFPAENLLVLKAEDLFERPAETMARVFAFVGVDPARGGGEFRARNVGNNRAEVDPATVAELDAFYAPHNRALYDLIGVDLGW